MFLHYRCPPATPVRFVEIEEVVSSGSYPIEGDGVNRVAWSVFRLKRKLGFDTFANVI